MQFLLLLLLLFNRQVCSSSGTREINDFLHEGNDIACNVINKDECKRQEYDGCNCPGLEMEEEISIKGNVRHL